MKPLHIVGIIVIAISITVVVSMLGDASQYVSFTEARSLALNGSESSIHVVGTLLKDQDGHVLGAESTPDRTACFFVMVDENNNQQRVFLNEPMPADLIRSEQVVVVGKYKDDLFVADKVLLKCPSKYQEEEINVSQR